MEINLANLYYFIAYNNIFILYFEQVRRLN